MPRHRQYTCREVIKKLQDHDEAFEVYRKRGKGSERVIYHPNINGRSESYPLPCHKEGADVARGHYAPIVRRFGLPQGFFNE
jgi:hypothetical protein